MGPFQAALVLFTSVAVLLPSAARADEMLFSGTGPIVSFNLPDSRALSRVSATIDDDPLQASKCAIGPCQAITTSVDGEYVDMAGSFPPGISNLAYINGDVLGNPLIDEQVVFTMTISGGALSASQISNVSFQYGTGTSEPRTSGTPNVLLTAVSLLLLVPAAALSLWHMARKMGYRL